MKPKKHPYSGKQKLIGKRLPKFIQLANIALDSSLIDHIKIMTMASNKETIIILKIPKFIDYEEKQIKVRLPLSKVIEILNQYN